jgi:flagellar biosynthesis/type III secretory pathway chaperone
MPDESTNYPSQPTPPPTPVSNPTPAPLTITEALQEIKTIGKRLEKKRQNIIQYIARDVRIKDPLESSGGSAQYIQRERQAIADLENRIIEIRTRIQEANLSNQLTIEGVTCTVSQWLNCASGQQSFAQGMLGAITKLRAEAQKQGGRAVPAKLSLFNARTCIRSK